MRDDDFEIRENLVNLEQMHTDYGPWETCM